jgi:DNA invertase Pin-like site-specific DNA recombinase/transcription elongation factor Elf1
MRKHYGHHAEEGGEMKKQSSSSSSSTAAIYLRLSRDDDLEGESNSIANQRRLLRKMATEYGYRKIEEFSDDGVTGTTFNRPGFNAMIEAIEAGKIAAVIVKDMSRLGRDYLKVGYYTEQFFPEHDIRFIAVSDGVDSDEGENDFIPFKNIMNEWYAKDTSKKLRTVWKVKGMAGEPLGPPPYGYRRNPENKKRWIVDPEAAEVVRRIYSMTLDGKGSEQIAAILTNEKALKPSAYCKTIGTNRPVGKRNQDPYYWAASTVAKILGIQEYCGDVLNFKTYTKSFKNKKRVDVDREDWVVFKDVHEPIIERDQWELVQTLRDKPKRRTSVTDKNLFSGILRCADCGSNLHFHFNQGNQEITYYNCSNYNNKRKACPSTHYVRTDFLEKVVLSDIKRIVKYARLHEDELAELLLTNMQQDSALEQQAREQKMKRLKERETQLDVLFENLYEDRAKGVLTEDRFMKMSARYEGEQAEVVMQIEQLQREVDSYDDKDDLVSEFLRVVRNCPNIKKLTTRILHQMVDEIIIHQAERKNGKWIQRIDILYNYVGVIDVPVSKELPEPVICVDTRKGVAVHYSHSESLAYAS